MRSLSKRGYFVLISLALIVLVNMCQHTVDANPYVHMNPNGVYIENPVQKIKNKIHHIKRQFSPEYQMHLAEHRAKQALFQNSQPARKAHNFYHKLRNLKHSVAALGQPNWSIGASDHIAGFDKPSQQLVDMAAK